MKMLYVKNLTLEKANKTILNNISAKFQNGNIYAIVGPNGAGKSTLAYVIMGLDDYHEYTGSIAFENKIIDRLSVYDRAKIGITLAWQEPARFEGLTVMQYLSASAKNSDSINDALLRVGLNPGLYLKRCVDKTLSGGERKRIEIASIIVMEPRVVLLDEPDSGIDIEAMEMIFETITYLKSIGTTVIMITHSRAVLSKADYAFLLCNGEIIDQGTTEHISHYFRDKCIPCSHKKCRRWFHDES